MQCSQTRPFTYIRWKEKRWILYVETVSRAKKCTIWRVFFVCCCWYFRRNIFEFYMKRLEFKYGFRKNNSLMKFSAAKSCMHYVLRIRSISARQATLKSGKKTHTLTHIQNNKQMKRVNDSQRAMEVKSVQRNMQNNGEYRFAFQIRLRSGKKN